eukprot:4892783-Lingulodinium_polyedra.AAC.1
MWCSGSGAGPPERSGCALNGALVVHCIGDCLFEILLGSAATSNGKGVSMVGDIGRRQAGLALFGGHAVASSGLRFPGGRPWRGP